MFRYPSSPRLMRGPRLDCLPWIQLLNSLGPSKLRVGNVFASGSFEESGSSPLQVRRSARGRRGVFRGLLAALGAQGSQIRPCEREAIGVEDLDRLDGERGAGRVVDGVEGQCRLTAVLAWRICRDESASRD